MAVEAGIIYGEQDYLDVQERARKELAEIENAEALAQALAYGFEYPDGQRDFLSLEDYQAVARRLQGSKQ